MSLAENPRTPFALFRRAVLVALATRGWVFLVLAGGAQFFAGGAPRSIDAWHGLLSRADAGWYHDLARYGYKFEEIAPRDAPGTSNLAFSPAYPWLMKNVARLTRADPFWTGVVLSNVMFLAAAPLLAAWLTGRGVSERTALFAVAGLGLAPAAIAFSSVFTESQFVLLTVLACWALDRERYWLAGFAAALLSATRPNGVFLVVYFAVWFLARHRTACLAAAWREPRELLPLALAPLGLFAHQAWCFQMTGDAYAVAHTVEAGWLRVAFQPVWKNFAGGFSGGGWRDRVWLGCVVLALFSLWPLVRRRWWDAAAFTLFMALFFLSNLPFSSLHRYVTALVPVWAGMALWCERPRWLSWVWLAVLGAALAAWGVAWATLEMIAV